LAGIATVEAANVWLPDSFIADYNGQFAIHAEQEASAFVADATRAWREILCIQEDRIVGNDNTVKWEGLSLQLPSSRLRPHFVKATVRVHAYPMAGWRCSGDRIGWGITTRRVASLSPSGSLHDTLPLRRFWSGACPGPEQERSG
jgi:hypothetical protein